MESAPYPIHMTGQAALPTQFLLPGNPSSAPSRCASPFRTPTRSQASPGRIGSPCRSSHGAADGAGRANSYAAAAPAAHGALYAAAQSAQSAQRAPPQVGGSLVAPPPGGRWSVGSAGTALPQSLSPGRDRASSPMWLRQSRSSMHPPRAPSPAPGGSGMLPPQACGFTQAYSSAMYGAQVPQVLPPPGSAVPSQGQAPPRSVSPVPGMHRYASTGSVAAASSPGPAPWRLSGREQERVPSPLGGKTAVGQPLTPHRGEELFSARRSASPVFYPGAPASPTFEWQHAGGLMRRPPTVMYG